MCIKDDKLGSNIYDPQGFQIYKTNIKTLIIDGQKVGKDNLTGETNTWENIYPGLW